MTWENGNSRTSSSAWKKIRQQAKHQLPYECAQCGDGEPLELDHIINVKRGGTDELNNLQWLCPSCHKIKTRKEAYRSRYKRAPKPPLGK